MSACKENIKPFNFGLLGILLALTVFAISANTIPPLTTTISQDFGVGYTTFGYIFFLQYLFFFIASVVGGWASDRFGIPNILLVTCGIFSVSALFFIGAVLNGLLSLIVWIIFLGLAGGSIETFGSIMVSGYDMPGSSKMMNLSQVFYCLGAIAAPHLVALCLTGGASWRAIFIMIGGLSTAIGILFLFAELRGREAGAIRIITRRTSQSVFRRTSRRMSRKPSQKLSRKVRRLFVLLAGLMFVYVVVEISIASWIAAYFERFLSITARSAAWRLGIFWTGLICGRSLIFILPHRYTQLHPLLFGAGGMGVGCVLLSLQSSITAATIFLIIIGIAAGPVWPVIVSVSREVHAVSSFTAAIIGIGALGAALGPIFSSLVIRYFGLRFLFPVLGCGCLILLAVSIWVAYYSRKDTSECESANSSENT